VLGGGDHEQRVRRGPARGLGHSRGVGVDADDERAGMRTGGGQHAAAVTGAEIDQKAVVARRQRVESADVDVVEAAASEHSEHAIESKRPGRIFDRRRRNSPGRPPRIDDHRTT
jgi:hypothetical protein